MRKVIAYEFVTLDGFTASANGNYDWGVDDAEMNQDSHEFFKSIDTIILGRVTYELFGAFWPIATLADAIVTDQMNLNSKVVFSKTLDTVSWGKWDNARLVKESAADEIRSMKHQPGKDMIIFGSATLVASLAQDNLIDEYCLLLNPLILGGSKPLFRGNPAPTRLKLLKTKNYPTGIVRLHYQTA